MHAVQWKAWQTAACTSKASMASFVKPSAWRNRSAPPRGAAHMKRPPLPFPLPLHHIPYPLPPDLWKTLSKQEKNHRPKSAEGRRRETQLWDMMMMTTLWHCSEALAKFPLKGSCGVRRSFTLPSQWCTAPTASTRDSIEWKASSFALPGLALTHFRKWTSKTSLFWALCINQLEGLWK